MPKSARFNYLIVLIVISALLVTGCWRVYKPGDDKTDKESGQSKTFAISDTYPYPGKDHIISDKEVGKKYNLYIYVTNPSGAQQKDVEAKNIKVELIDNTRNIAIIIAKNLHIPEGTGYLVIENLSYDRQAQVHIHVEGTIVQNKNHQFTVAVNSNKFWIKRPRSEPPSGEGEPIIDGLMIWEKEIVE